jgi:hypothetical protein
MKIVDYDFSKCFLILILFAPTCNEITVVSFTCTVPCACGYFYYGYLRESKF